MHAELLQRIRTGLPSVQARIPSGYGLTENGGQATAASGADIAERPGSSGEPLPCVELTFLPDQDYPMAKSSFRPHADVGLLRDRSVTD